MLSIIIMIPFVYLFTFLILKVASSRASRSFSDREITILTIACGTATFVISVVVFILVKIIIYVIN